MTGELHGRFRDVITSEEDLRLVVGHAPKRAVDKVVRFVYEHSRSFIAHAPFVFVASAGTGGMLDVSPRAIPQALSKSWTKGPWRFPTDWEIVG